MRFSFFFFFKQKTAYEMRIRDWSSDVCSSDLVGQQRPRAVLEDNLAKLGIVDPMLPVAQIPDAARHHDRYRVRNPLGAHRVAQRLDARIGVLDRKSTRLNSSH